MASNAVIRAGVDIIGVLLREELLLDQKKKRKTRRFWMRQWILKRNQLGASETLLKELALEDIEGYRNHLRISEEKFLLSKIQDNIKKQEQ